MLTPGTIVRKARNQLVKIHQYLGIKRQLKNAVLRTPPLPVPRDGPVSVHMLCSHSRIHDGIATLKSFYRFVSDGFPLVFHDDGTLTPTDIDLLRHHLPGIEIIRREAADPGVENQLRAAGRTRCVTLRRSQPHQLKLFDFAFYARGDPFIQMDSDILFYQPPAELLRAAQLPAVEFVDRYNRDTMNAYTWTPGQVRQYLGVELLPQFNVGLMCLRRDETAFALFERAMEIPILDPGAAYFLEQTLTAIESSRRGASPLPDEYDVAARHARTRGAVICQHYCSIERPHFYEHFCQIVYPELMGFSK